MNGIQKIIKICAITLGIFIIVNIFSVLIFGLSFFTNIDFSNNNNGNNFDEIYTNINNINIEVDATNLRLVNGSEVRVIASNVSNKFKVTNDNTTLKIEEENLKFWNKSVSGEITIYIPNNINLNELKIENGGGRVDIENIKSNILDIDQGAGVLTIGNSNFSSSEIDGGAGKITITSSNLNNLNIDAGVGSIDIESFITGKSNIDCGVGNINITLLGNINDYRIELNKGVGNINIDGQKQESNTVYGNGINTLKLDGGVGNINIQFN